ncbi:MAG: threonine/serine exporter family protein [Longimicrobiales bacterium]
MHPTAIRLLTAPVPSKPTPPSPHRQAGTTPDVDEAARFFLLLAECLHVFGMGAHNVERVLSRVAAALGVEGQFLVTPTFVIFTVGPVGGSRTHMSRVHGQELDLDRLTRLHRIVQRIVEGSLTSEQARTRLEALRRPRRPWRAAPAALAHALSASGAAVILQGGWPEVLAAGGLGVILGVLLHYAETRPNVQSIMPLMAGLVSAAMVGLTAAWLHPVVPYIPTLAAIVTLLPGMTLTVAINEVAHGHTVSGGARLTGVMMTLLQLGFGVALGKQVALTLVGATPTVHPEALPGWLLVGAAGVVVATFALRNRARKEDFPLLLLTAGVGLAASRLGTHFLGTELGVLAAAWAIGTTANAVSRWWNVPAATAMLPALLLLVPGSLGFGSVSSLLDQDVVVGLQAAFSMVVVALSLVTGLLLASLTTRPGDLF